MSTEIPPMLIAAYQFCHHLEQNGLYDRDEADEGYHYDWRLPPQCRETHKVYNRSGAATVLRQTETDRNTLATRLEELDCIVRHAGESSLATGFWRTHLAWEYGYDSIFREGGYSVPHTYVPSINLAIETFEAYRNGDAEREEVVERITSTTAVDRTLDDADRIFDSLADTDVPRWKLFRVMHSQIRFHTGVSALKTYVRHLDGDVISANTADEALGLC